MGKLIERIKAWESNTFYSYKDEIEVKPLIIAFVLMIFVPILIFCVISLILRGISLKAEEWFYAIFAILVLFFICCIPGVVLSLVCGFIMDKFKIRPIKGIVLTIFFAFVCFGGYTLYRMYWPIGNEQVLLEEFISKKQNCRIIVVHKERCRYFRGGFQEKENFQKFLKGKNYMYCYCVGFADIELLDAYSKKNCRSVGGEIISDYERSEGGFDIDEEFEKFEDWYDDTERGHGILYGYDLLEKRYKKIHTGILMKEYYHSDFRRE